MYFALKSPYIPTLPEPKYDDGTFASILLINPVTKSFTAVAVIVAAIAAVFKSVCVVISVIAAVFNSVCAVTVFN